MNNDPFTPEFLEELRSAVAAFGMDSVRSAVRTLVNRGDDESLTLTIVANEGVHYLDPRYHRGEVFVASRGSFDLSSIESATAAFEHVIRGVAIKLGERPWQRVFLVPFGPSALSMQLKLLVYRVCGLESVDVVQLEGQRRGDLCLNLRELILSAKA